MAAGGLRYLGGWPDEAAMDRMLREACAAAGVAIEPMPEGLRRRDAGSLRFYLNYGAGPVVHGGWSIPAAGVLALRDGRPLWPVDGGGLPSA
jgi:beta-galactosidase